MSNMSGRKLGQYEIIDELGSGGMATVYRGIQPSIGREVAIKLLPVQFLQDSTFLERFSREVKVIARLQHPRILPVIDFGEQDGIPYIVMALLTGGTLEERIEQGQMELDDVLHMVEQMAEALDHAHSENIIHRDFKPSNILLDKRGNTHLADFGIAKMSEATVALTGNSIIGTPAYMAPEMFQEQSQTHRVDIYALGVTLYQMLVGVVPYERNTPAQVMLMHISEAVPNVLAARPDLPESVQTVVDRAMAKSADQRYSSAGMLAGELAKAASGLELAPSPAPSSAKSDAMDRPPSARGSRKTAKTPAAQTKISADKNAPVAIIAPDIATPEEIPLRRMKPIYILPLLVVALVVVFIVLIAPGLTPDGGTATAPVAAVNVEATESLPVEEGATSIAPSSTATQEKESAAAEATSTLSATATVAIVSLREVVDDIDELLKLEGHSDTVQNVAWSADGTRLVAAARDNKILEWDTGSGQLLSTFEGGGALLDWSAAGNRLAAVRTLETEVLLWDMSSGELTGRMQGHSRDVVSLAWSPDGTRVASTSLDLTTIIVDANSGQLLTTLEGHSGLVRAVEWSPDGSKLASGGDDNSIIIWNAESGERELTLTGHSGFVYGLAWSPDGTSIASAGGDKAVMVWNTQFGDALLELRDHIDVVTSVAWSPDGLILASGSFDARIMLWDALSGQRLRRLQVHEFGVTHLAWSPDGSLLASASVDKTVIVWGVAP